MFWKESINSNICCFRKRSSKRVAGRAGELWRTNETTPVSFIAYSASGTFRARGFCLELRMEQDPDVGRTARCQRRRKKRGRGATRAIGLRKESVLSRDFRISFCGGLLVLFPVDPWGLCRMAGEGQGGKGETLKRGECDYKGGDAVTASYSRVKRESWKREFGLEGHMYVTTPSLLRRADETCIPRVFRSVHLSESSERRVKRDKTNLGGVQRVSLYLVLYLLSLSLSPSRSPVLDVFLQTTTPTTTTG